MLVGRCWEAGGAPAYWPWVQSLRDYVRDSDPVELRSQLGAGAADLAQIIPELRQRLPDLGEPPPLEPETARFRLFDATAEFLRRASETHPIVVALDDLHAADAPSLLLLRFLARQLGSSRVLVLGAYRDVDPIPGAALTELLAEVAREPVCRRLSLAGLSAREVAEYVDLSASEIASPPLVATLHEESGGNPLFVGEIVRLLAVEGVGAGSTAALVIPQSVREVIARRLTHLSQECGRILVLASVLGREFALDALARLTRIPEDRLLEVLDEAMRARVVTDVPGAFGRLRFAHVLIRDALYGDLTTARRVRLHRLAVETLEELYGDQPGPHLAELAHHAIAGSELEKGLLYARRAGDRALALYAHEESARLYRMALEALELAGRSEERARCELLLSLGEAELRAANTPAAKEAFLGAAGIARRLGLPRELARAAAGYGGRFMWARPAGDERLVPLLEEGLDALADEDVELRARLLARLSGALRDEHSRDRRDRLSREAVELARAAGDAAALAYALDGRAAAISAPDTVAECLALAAELEEVAKQIGDVERLVNAFDHRRTAQVMAGDLRDVEDRLAAESRIADDLRQPFQLWQVCSAQAMLALVRGELAEAERLVARARSLGERAYPAVAIPVYLVQRHILCDFHGRLDDVAPALRDSLAEYPTRPVLRCALVQLDARLGRLPEARRAIDELAPEDFSAVPFDQEWLYSMSLLAEATVLIGDAGSAAVLYRLLLPWSELCAADHPEGIRGAVGRYVGLLATTLARWDEAEWHFDEAIALNERIGARPWGAHTRNDYARMLLARDAPGDRARARGLAAAALATYRELGMPGPGQP